MQPDWTTHAPNTYTILFQEAIMLQARETCKEKTPSTLVSFLAKDNSVYYIVYKYTVFVQ